VHRIEHLAKKRSKLVVGLMSGTSADGIDSVLVEITGAGLTTRVKQRAFITHPYPKGFKNFLLRNSSASTARLDEITRLDALVAYFFADAVRRVAQEAGISLHSIDLIGSHGQTVCHLPQPIRVFGKSVRSTLQIGNHSIISQLTGIPTVGDFRPADIAAGGSGAPLVPYVDYILYHSRTQSRGVLNIGGIANLTVLPAKSTLNNVSAFDTGPGNMVVDALTEELFGKQFDKDGAIAQRGKIIIPLLRWMMRHPYLSQRPPKSTGREAFGREFVRRILHHSSSRRARRTDFVTTATEFTALSIYQSYLRFVRRRTSIYQLFVSGGGIHNVYLMDSLSRYFGNRRVRAVDASTVDPDAKEAVCFAILANETINGNPSNVPNATGARHRAVLGTVALPA
jgi:anhydro-N-acetylmuramic acid kinase